MWTVPDNVKEWHTEYDKQYTHTEILEATIEDDEPVAPPPHHHPIILTIHLHTIPTITIHWG